MPKFEKLMIHLIDEYSVCTWVSCTINQLVNCQRKENN